MPQLYCLLDYSGSMAEWRKKEAALSLANSLLFASKAAWPGCAAFQEAFSLWKWQGGEVRRWSKETSGPEGAANPAALRGWIENNPDCDRILVISDGNLDRRACGQFGEWLRGQTDIRLEAICVGPDCARENLAVLSSSGLCFDMMDALSALAVLAGEPIYHDGNIADLVAEITEDDEFQDDDE